MKMVKNTAFVAPIEENGTPNYTINAINYGTADGLQTNINPLFLISKHKFFI